MSRYCTDIGTYIGKKTDIGPDIGNIGFGKERVCPDIVPISAPILPISGPISGKMTRYRVLVTPHCRHGTPEIGPSSEWLPERASLVQTACGGTRRKTLSNLSKADITNIRSDIGKKITISCLGDTISETAISGHTLISGRVLSRYLGRYRDIISRLVLNFFSR